MHGGKKSGALWKVMRKSPEHFPFRGGNIMAAYFHHGLMRQFNRFIVTVMRSPLQRNGTITGVEHAIPH